MILFWIERSANIHFFVKQLLSSHYNYILGAVQYTFQSIEATLKPEQTFQLVFFRHFQVKRKWSEQEEEEGAFGTFAQPSFNLCSTIIVAVRENSISIPLFYQGIDNLIRIVFLLNKLSQKFSRKKVKQIASKCPFDLVLNCKAIL